MKNKDYVIERMAKAGHNSMFEEEWDDLAENSIERAIWKEAAEVMLAEVRKCWEETKKKPRS